MIRERSWYWYYRNDSNRIQHKKLASLKLGMLLVNSCLVHRIWKPNLDFAGGCSLSTAFIPKVLGHQHTHWGPSTVDFLSRFEVWNYTQHPSCGSLGSVAWDGRVSWRLVVVSHSVDTGIVRQAESSECDGAEYRVSQTLHRTSSDMAHVVCLFCGLLALLVWEIVDCIVDNIFLVQPDEYHREWEVRTFHLWVMLA